MAAEIQMTPWVKFIDWPFLLFIGIGSIVYFFKEEVGELIKRGGISITWGKNKFSIAELPNQLDENFAPLVDDVNTLRDQVSKLEKRINQLEGRGNLEVGVDLEAAEPEMPHEQRVADARNIILKALDSGHYRWRSIDRLATKTMLPETEVQDILRGMKEVVISRGKSGKTIARLENR